jgi:undecaprenyl-diphosphatase
MKPAIHNFDLRWIQAVQGLSRSLLPVMQAASLVGQPLAVGVVLAAFSIYFWRAGEPLLAKTFAITIITLPISTLLKQILHRARPTTYVVHFIHSYSFPSGHAYATMVGYGLLAWVAARHLPAPWSWIAAILLILLILLVGVSRVYLGAHYPSDVVGGWLLGLLVLAVIIVAFRI